MEYGFKLNKKNAEVQYKLDLQDCIITGNTVQYHLDDNSILAYDLDENGNVVGSSGKSVENVELTRTPLSIFKAVAEYADKNKNGFDKKDLKDLDKDDLAKVITSKLIEGGVYNLRSIEVTKKSVHLTMVDIYGNERNLEIEFLPKSSKIAEFFRNLFKSNKKDKPDISVSEQPKPETKADVDTNIVVGDLEEAPTIVEEDTTIVETIPADNKKDSKIKLLGLSGMQLNEEMLTDKSIKRRSFTDEEKKIFDLYNTNKEGKSKKYLDETELKNLLQDLIGADKLDSANKSGQQRHKKTNFGYLLPVEISNFLESKGLAGEVDAQTLISFVQKIVNYCAIEDLTNDTGLKSDILANIDDDNLLTVMAGYDDENRNSLVHDLCKEKKKHGDTSLHIVRDKLVSFAKKCGVDYADFETEFDLILGKISGKRDNENIDSLDSLVANFAEKLRGKEPLYKANKNGIINMLSDSSLCYSREDLEKVVENIMTYANNYNPRKTLEEISISNSKTEDLVKSLTDSELLDYYPIFVASIISQETRFLEKGSDIFDAHGNGVMQITQSIVDDMYINSWKYDTDFIEELKTQYADSTACYNAIKNQNNLDLHYETGVVGLKGKLVEAISFLSKGKYKLLEVNNPEQLLELSAMHYNGNGKDKIKDKEYPDAEKVYVKYIYARNVIQRFKRFTPSGVAEGSYYEYNPVDKEWVYK